MKIELTIDQIRELLLASQFVDWENGDFTTAVEVLRSASENTDEAPIVTTLRQAREELEELQEGVPINFDGVLHSIRKASEMFNGSKIDKARILLGCVVVDLEDYTAYPERYTDKYLYAVMTAAREAHDLLGGER